MKIYILKDYGLFAGDLDCSCYVYKTLKEAREEFKIRVKDSKEACKEVNGEYRLYKDKFWARTLDWEQEIVIQQDKI